MIVPHKSAVTFLHQFTYNYPIFPLVENIIISAA